ncbi:MAG: hypothetical protein NT166_29560 [Candidatus Aminicenantes bacterium]|nr:hypothetical protein [Candidatus Aminicenantes bacterium]
MKNLFEIPVLLTLDGIAFGHGDPLPGTDPPKTCSTGCDKGCQNGGCFPGSG